MWKVQVEAGDKINSKDTVVVILEAMKLEIAVRADSGSGDDGSDESQQEIGVVGGTVEKVLIKPNDVVNAGQPLILVRKGSNT